MPKREVLSRFKEKLPFESPKQKRELLFYLLMKRAEENARAVKKNSGIKLRKVLSPRKLRRVLFTSAAKNPKKCEITEALKIAGIGGVTKDDVLIAAFCDLPMERSLGIVPTDLSAAQLCTDANLCLAQALIGRSSSVQIIAKGNASKIIRQAKLRRLLCNVYATDNADNRCYRVEISGPLSIFGHTLLYGRALASLVPLLGVCNEYSLSASCSLRGERGQFTLRSGDPISVSTHTSLFDSKLEMDFANAFLRKTKDWDLVREPEPILVAGDSINNNQRSLIFPDFKIQHRRDSSQYYYLEIMGYWTNEYLNSKLSKLKSAGISRLIICVDQKLICDAEKKAMESLGVVIMFKNKVDAKSVLDFLAQM